ncbi:Cof-type HAD-IIB family hydrolase [Lachnospiraceae bacterium C1.1]|nr:Cof-type HAD-IIB family hydrolase [Lachnospiraceae bacterium C1.1]
MIKLIATDVDGTLVKDSSPEVYPEMIEMIKKIREQDIIVCIASGRQYYSIARMFNDIAHDLIFIAGNGSHIKCRGTDMNVIKMDRKYVEELAVELRGYKEKYGYEIIFEGPGITLIESENEDFISLIRDNYRNEIKLVKDALKEPVEITKVSIFNRPSIRDLGENILIPEWKDRVRAVMAGEDWVDFMDKSVDKGNALKTIQDFFHISKEETMVFGDNGNDIGMLNVAAESYAVETAPDEVKAHAAHICGSWKDKGVLRVLEDVYGKI